MSWSSVLGQPTACAVLRRHLQQQRIAPAYLFTGPEGVGKRLAALEFAKALNCEHGTDEACDQCDACGRIERGSHPDLHRVSPQGALAMIRVDEVRQVLSRVGLRPYMGRLQVAIIDGADRLNEEAGNLLLKTLEEPPRRSRFLLLTSQPDTCLPTIASRCERVRFAPLAPALIERLLAARQVEPSIASAVSRLANGSLSRAIDLAGGWPSHQEMIAQLGRTDAVAWIEWPVPTEREAVARWLEGSIEWLRDVSLAAAGSDASIRHTHAASAIRRQAQRWEPEACAAAVIRMVELSESLERLVSARMVGTLLREQWVQLAAG